MTSQEKPVSRIPQGLGDFGQSDRAFLHVSFDVALKADGPAESSCGLVGC